MKNSQLQRNKEQMRHELIKKRIKEISSRITNHGISIISQHALLQFNTLFLIPLHLFSMLNCHFKKKLRGRGICIIILCIFFLSMLCSSLHAHSDGAPLSCLGGGLDRLNWLLAAPSMFTCGNLGCHYQYPINSGKGKFMLFVLETCEPGEIVDILVSFKQTDTDFHGFQITAQDRYYNRLVGTFINVGDDEDTQVEAGGRFATHTKKGTQQKYWHVKWQAPQSDFWVANPVRFYAMGVESNNDGTAMGDYIYKASRLIAVESKKTKKEPIRAIKRE